MGWTQWRVLLVPGRDLQVDFDNDGPACYELGVGGPRGSDIRPHYVGETNNETARMRQYSYNGSHNNGVIGAVLRSGKCLYYRACAMETKRDAREMQDRMLKKFKYEWNKQGNLHD